MPFDTECYKIATIFIADLEAEKNIVVPIRITYKLAQLVQDVIEDFFDNFVDSEPFDTRREREEWLEGK